MSRWYRAYEGTVTDAKLGEVALVAACSRSVAIAAWHCLLESAASVNDGGKYDCTARRIAVILGEPIATIEAVLAEMLALGMVQDGTICAWARRQYESDNSTERSRRHREAKRNAAKSNENSDATERNGDATLQGRCATPPYTETETDTEKKNNKAGFAFCGEVVRLRRNHFDQWAAAYDLLDLPALLQSRDDWLKDQPEPERKRWYQSTSNWLAKKQQEARTAARKADEYVMPIA